MIHRRNLLRTLTSVIFLSVSWAAHGSGDPVRGQMLFNVTYKCNACHDKGVIPAPGIFDISSGGTVNGLLAATNDPIQMAALYANTLAMNPTDLADVAA